MDEYSGKRHIGGIAVARKGSSLVSRDTIDNRDQNGQFCNRIGCSGRLKYSKSSQIDSAEKPKYSRPSFRSSNGKEMIGSSSKTSFPINNVRKLPQDSLRDFPSDLKTDSSESCDLQGESDVTELIPSISRTQTGLQPEMRDSSAGKVPEVGSSSVDSNNKSVRVLRHKPRSGYQNALPGTSITSTSYGMGSGARNNSSGSRYGLRNLRCNSISDVIPRSGSPSEPKTRRDMLKKRSSEGESSSSSKGKSSVAPSEDGQVSPSNSGIAISGSRRSRNWASNSDSTAVSVRTRRSTNTNTTNTTIRLSSHNINASSLTDSDSIIPQLPRPETYNEANLNSLPYQSSVDFSSNASSSSTLSGRSDNLPGIISFTSTEHGVAHALRRNNLNGVAEVLLALERIEQDEELIYEQLLALENNLFLGNLNFYDQHREMRLDIDNMSYEELLALEERMGTVSTALSEEAFAKSIRKKIYHTISLDVGAKGCDEDEADIKCSICQEEYAVGDEIGKLECEHGYHVACIQQWLRLKNWCPICKASAAPS